MFKRVQKHLDKGQGNYEPSTSISFSDKQENLQKVKRIQQIIIVIMLSLLVLIEVLGIRPQCPLHYFTGLSCPFCGLTRLFEQLMCFDVVQAFRWNPFMFIQIALSPFVLYFLQKHYIESGKIQHKFKILFFCWLTVAVAFMILRNTQYFSYLLPTNIR